MAPPSSFLAWEIPWTEEPGDYSPWSCKESDMTEQLSMFQVYNMIRSHRLPPFKVILRYLLHFMCCTGYPYSLFILHMRVS